MANVGYDAAVRLLFGTLGAVAAMQWGTCSLSHAQTHRSRLIYRCRTDCMRDGVHTVGRSTPVMYVCTPQHHMQALQRLSKLCMERNRLRDHCRKRPFSLNPPSPLPRSRSPRMDPVLRGNGSAANPSHVALAKMMVDLVSAAYFLVSHC